MSMTTTLGRKAILTLAAAAMAATTFTAAPAKADDGQLLALLAGAAALAVIANSAHGDTHYRADRGRQPHYQRARDDRGPGSWGRDSRGWAPQPQPDRAYRGRQPHYEGGRIVYGPPQGWDR